METLNLTSQTSSPASLRNAVLDRYADSVPRSAGAPIMPTDDLLAYFADWRDFDIDPVSELTADPERPRPSIEYLALIRWVCETHRLWENNYPLEEPLSSELRELLPVATGLAVVDGDFLVPGRHGFHRLMDALYNAAVGWHAELGRAGEPLRDQIRDTVRSARRWLQERNADFDRLATSVQEQAEADEQRNQRMIRRAIDAERGRLRAASARNQAARMINGLLDKYRTPGAIANFLKGPWYDSAQLILLKHGPDSGEWRELTRTTEVLLKSLQSTPHAEDRQALELANRLPGEIGDKLVSLQHDAEAQRNATQLIEYAHLRNIRGQPLELIANEPIADADATSHEADEAAVAKAGGLTEGQWFRIPGSGQPPRRARLILKLEKERQLLFANLIGVKEMQAGFGQFGAMLIAGEAQPVEEGPSYTNALSKAAHETPPEDTSSTGEFAEAAENGLPGLNEAEETEGPAVQTQQEEDYRGPGRVSYLKLVDTEPPEEAIPPDTLADSDDMVLTMPEDEDEDADEDADEDNNAEFELDLNLEDDDTGYDFDTMSREEAGESSDVPENSSDLWRRAAQETLGAAQETPAPAPSAEQPATHPATPQNRPPPLSAPDSEDMELNLPMGAWLGFHDTEAPLMARLAVHDRERDSYIFVNRNGIKLRDMTRRDLIELIERGEVEILQAQSNFQEYLRAVRHRTDR